MNPIAEQIARTEIEIAEEKAGALVRIAGRLQEILDAASKLRRQILAGDVDSDAVERYAGLIDDARQWRWYLEVQREAIGLRCHDRLDEWYPSPAMLDPEN